MAARRAGSQQLALPAVSRVVSDSWKRQYGTRGASNSDSKSFSLKGRFLRSAALIIRLDVSGSRKATGGVSANCASYRSSNSRSSPSIVTCSSFVCILSLHWDCTTFQKRQHPPHAHINQRVQRQSPRQSAESRRGRHVVSPGRRALRRQLGKRHPVDEALSNMTTQMPLRPLHANSQKAHGTCVGVLETHEFRQSTR